MSQFADDVLQENLASVRQRVEQAAVKSGRQACDVRLIGVTKYIDAQATRQLVQAGCHCLGESRPQVLWEKGEKLQDLDVEWHMIGPLQRNKIRKTLLFTHYLHSCDSLKLLHAIDAVAAETQRQVKCLLQVNISGEAAKQGFRPEEVAPALPVIREMRSVQLVGLMGMGSLAGDLDTRRHEFRQLRQLLEACQGSVGDNLQLTELSMGMSSDFEVAIEEGATMVRVGSVLFDRLR
ncbi:MAG: YggS family pyridoxal phosphate-dependent enzyme [Mariniblastus sp.]|nr:YggS family pyridoxal phosphate-dependent enzyme [Mariniblastus sp.]